MDSPEQEPLENTLRDVLRSDSPTPADTERFLADVHSGARRRRRHQVVGTAAAILLVAGGGLGVAESGLLDSSKEPIAASPSSTQAASDSNTDSAASSGPSTAHTTPSTAPASANEAAVLSLTSTGIDAQWALAVTSGGGCNRLDGCATVFQNPVGTETWSELSPISYKPTVDRSERYAVSQLRFVGTSGNGYNGWAFGGALLSTHGMSAGEAWQPVHLPTQGAVTALEAYGDTVYAVLTDGLSAARLVASPVNDDQFGLVETGHALGEVSQLVASDGVVAFINSTPDGRQVIALGADSTWSDSDPCASGEPTQLSAGADSLWALCSTGSQTTVAVLKNGEGRWQSNGQTYDGASLLTALPPDSALVAEPDGVSKISEDSSTRLVDDDFTDATMFGFTNDRIGFVILDGAVQRTDDGGQTWTPDDVTP